MMEEGDHRTWCRGEISMLLASFPFRFFGQKEQIN